MTSCFATSSPKTSTEDWDSRYFSQTWTHAGPMNLERRFRIETLQGIDIYFCSSESDTLEYKPVIDKKTRELIDKGYLTDTGKGYSA